MDSKPEKPYSVEIEYFRQLIFSPSQKRKEEGQRQQPSDFHLFKRKTLEVIEEVIEEEIDLPVIIKKDNENDSKELIINIPNLMSDHNSAEEEIPGDSYEKNIICDQPIPQSSFSTLRQMIIPFIFAGIGEVCAGIILNNVQNWPAYNAIPQFLVMLPAICGLIGNIETTLSSRLSTHSNLGTLDNFSDAKSLVIGNAAVVLCQASTVGIFAAFASLFMSYITNTSRESITPMNVLLLTSSAATTSIIVNIILGTVLNVIVITSRKLKVNPDNIATPIAASFGDFFTISILAEVSNFIFTYSVDIWLPISILGVVVVFAPMMAFIARRSIFTHSVILTGWTPIIGAVIIEQPGGVVMDNAFSNYDVMSTFQPLVNGITGNLASIQTSRLSTYLHQTAPPGKLPKDQRACVQPFAVFFGKDNNCRLARLLWSLVIPTHILFLILIYFWQKNFVFTAPFLLTYFLAIQIQCTIVLYLGYCCVMWSWRKKLNPDNSSIPFNSVMADFFGNFLMAGAFTFLNAIGDVNAIKDYGNTVVTNSTTTLNNKFEQHFG